MPMTVSSGSNLSVPMPGPQLDGDTQNISQIIAKVYPHTPTEYRCSVSIGTPPRPFNFLLDTGSWDMWVFGTQCENCRSATHKYDVASSSTGVDLKQVAPGGACEFVSFNNMGSDLCKPLEDIDGTSYSGNRVMDTIEIAGANITGHVFTMVTSYSSPSELDLSDVDGIIGMGLHPQSSNTPGPSLAERMTQENTTGDNQVSYYIAKTEGYGFITFGGYNTSLFANNASDAPVVWLPFLPDYALESGKLALPLISASLDHTVIDEFTSHESPTVLNRNEGNTGSSVVDTGTSQSIVSYALLDALAQSLNQSGSVFKLYYNLNDTSRYTYGVDCAMKRESAGPQVTLEFAGGVSLSISAQEYVSAPQLAGSVSFCQLMLHGGEYGAGSYLIGNTFLKRYVTVFDYDTKQIGFALAAGRSAKYGTVLTGTNNVTYVASKLDSPTAAVGGISVIVVGLLAGGLGLLIVAVISLAVWIMRRRKRRISPSIVENMAEMQKELDDDIVETQNTLRYVDAESVDDKASTAGELTAHKHGLSNMPSK
ncbi:aspartic peptidase domain-containing protein [Chytriomyces sp. MP71]|nr:aspartic peptidase domain-containing protein [Chytriomyces sp. MP71]